MVRDAVLAVVRLLSVMNVLIWGRGCGVGQLSGGPHAVGLVTTFMGCVGRPGIRRISDLLASVSMAGCYDLPRRKLSSLSAMKALQAANSITVSYLA